MSYTESPGFEPTARLLGLARSQNSAIRVSLALALQRSHGNAFLQRELGGGVDRTDRPAVAPAIVSSATATPASSLGGLSRQAAATPGPAPAAPAPTGAAVISDEDKEEFKLLTGASVGKAKLKGKDLDPFADVADYVAYRDTYFGSAAAYATAKATADAEFDTKGFPTDVVGQTESKDFKRALYRWVREALVRTGVKDPVKALKAGATKDLQTKLEAVKKVIPTLPAKAVLVARPQKQGGYRLGTISEHGKGKAVDLTPQSNNPHLTGKEWTFILNYTGMSPKVDKAAWLKDPDTVWQAVYDLNEKFVQQLEADLKAGKKLATILAGKMSALRGAVKLDASDATKVSHGFFDLDKATVQELHKQGFIWGVTFPTKDLHHFEIP